MKVVLITTVVAAVTVAATQAYYIKPDRTRQPNGFYDAVTELIKDYQMNVLDRVSPQSGRNVPMQRLPYNINMLNQLLSNRLEQQEVEGNRNEAYNGDAIPANELAADATKRGRVCQEIIFAPWKNSLCKRKEYRR